MNRNWVQIIGSIVLFGSIVVIDVTIWKRFDFFAAAIHPTVLAVTVVTARLGFWPGVLAAAFAGWTFRLFSTFAGFVHPAGFLMVVVIMSLLNVRVFAQRSVSSLIALISIGTLTYYLTIFLAAEFVQIFQPAAANPVWRNWTWPVVQLLVHPMIGWLLWQISGRARRHATATLKLQQPF